MRILTRLPADLTAGIRDLDPMTGRIVETPAPPPVTDDAPRYLSHHDAENRVVITAADHRPRPRRGKVVVAAVTVVVAGVLVGVAVAHWPTASTTSPAVGVASTAATPVGVSSDAAKADAARRLAWTTFPVDRSPRPLVLLQPDVIDPASGFPDGDSKAAYLDHHIRLATALPTPDLPDRGYPLRPAADAVAALTGDADPSAADALAITSVTLSQHAYATDRGDDPLPAWAVRFAGVTDPAYVLAVADSARFVYPQDGSSWVGSGRVAVRGNQLTFALTPEHTSTGPCDVAYTQSAQVTGSAAVVELAITTTNVASTPDPSESDTYACGGALIGPAEPALVPGTPGTRTVTLAEGLGNRPVVDARGVPWLVTVVS